VSYPTPIYVTYVVHGLQGVCETIRVPYQNVYMLVANAKKNFMKSSERKGFSKNKARNTPLPPAAVITRGGT
jgi:hypothetical protein